MKKLFSTSQIDAINAVAEKSKQLNTPPKVVASSGMIEEIQAMSNQVLEYFKDSTAILIQNRDELHDYVSDLIEAGIAGIDTETTGLDRVYDTIVGASLYYPGGTECYIPMRHLVPLFDEPYKGQLTYQEVSEEFQRIADSDVKLIFANADFDLSMINKDLGVDFIPRCYYDVILAWRCLKENEKDNSLKALYAKYVMKGKVDPKKFSDFFTPKLFPYCKPEIAKLYAANDAKITYDLYVWQLPYVTKTDPKCQKHHLEAIADLIWNIEFPLMQVCQDMHRRGLYLDRDTARVLMARYSQKQQKAMQELADIVQGYLQEADYSTVSRCPFRNGAAFNPNSSIHVQYLLKNILKLDIGKSVDKNVLAEINLPVTKKILEVRGLVKLISTYIEKLPKSTTADGKVHATFKSIGADCVTGDTIIPTSDGFFLLSDVCESAGCVEATHVEVSGLSIVNLDQNMELADSVIKYSDYDTIRVTTECGFTIEGTLNHPIMLSKYTAADKIGIHDSRLNQFWDDRRFVELQDVQIGDYVEMPCSYWIGPSDLVETGFKLQPAKTHTSKIAKVPTYYDQEFAEFLGMYHADGAAGYREGTYTVAISNDDPDVIGRVDALSVNLFGVEASHYTAQSDNHEVDTYINCVQISDIDKILSHGKQHKRIPEAIWRSPRDVINSYIRGMTLDSSVYLDECGRIALELSVIDKQDADFIQCYLLSQGILCHRSYNQNKDGWRSPRLVFNADNYALFRDNIGFIQSSKYRETRPCVKNCYASRRIGNSIRLKVKQIEHSRNTVYDLHVPRTHSFVSNGMISHNTGRFSSEAPNMQNIPSHAGDIRHLFRATPKQVKLVDAVEADSEIHVELDLEDSINTPDGEMKVRLISVGDKVLMMKDSKPVTCTVIDIQDGTGTRMLFMEEVI